MAPARTSTRRSQLDQNVSLRPAAAENNDGAADEELFLEPMMGTPLAMYIEKDVADRDALAELITVSRVHALRHQVPVQFSMRS